TLCAGEANRCARICTDSCWATPPPKSISAPRPAGPQPRDGLQRARPMTVKTAGTERPKTAIRADHASLANSRRGAESMAGMKRADVVVVGGGVNGASTAYHLAARGVKSVLLIERKHLAAGAPGTHGAPGRMHHTNEAESRLALESLKIFRDF